MKIKNLVTSALLIASAISVRGTETSNQNNLQTQKHIEMKTTTDSSITYVHANKPSFKSKNLKFLMKLMGMKNALEKNLTKGKIKNEAAPISKSLAKKCTIEEQIIEGRKVWTISPKTKKSDKVIFFFHGGAYVFNIYPQHWDLIEKLIENTGATFVVHDYPLVPQHTHKEAFAHTAGVYNWLLKKFPNKKISFMGDSAGGGLALAFAQTLSEEGKVLPVQLILSAPWLDASLTNPDIAAIDKNDPMLGVAGLQMAAKTYASDKPVTDYRISPINGDFKNLPKISFFAGTHDIFCADTRKLHTLLTKEQIPHNYYEYPKMFHNWCIMVNMPESKSVIQQMTKLINEN